MHWRYNPPRWTISALREVWPLLLDLVGPDRLPESPVAEEYGSGHYGCVWPTRSGQVLKITSDRDEAKFVAVALQGFVPDGLTRYHQIIRLGERTHYQRPVYLIWRDEAYHIGALNHMEREAQDIRRSGRVRGREGERSRYRKATSAEYENARYMIEGVEMILKFKTHAHEVRRLLKKGPLITRKQLSTQALEMRKKAQWWLLGSESTNHSLYDTLQTAQRYRGVERLAVHLATCVHLATMMSCSNPITSSIGAVMDYFIDKEILLADVHLNNIGRIEYDPDENPGDMCWGITDPGHAVWLTSKWDNITIPNLIP